MDPENHLALVAGSQVRKLAACATCGETREIAAFHLCFRCYRRRERTAAKEQIIDRHSPGIRKEQKRIIRAFASVMAGLADLRVGQDDVLEIKHLLMPYLAPAHHLLFVAADSEVFPPEGGLGESEWSEQ